MGKKNPDAISMAKDFKERAKKKYGIKRIIIFGSQVTGKTRPGSDIDLLVVSNNFRSRAKMMSKLYAEWHVVQKKKHPVDFLCYTPREFNRMSKQVTIVKQALEEGVEI
ncbi:nucleotidyltransferase domain-containing protein [Candidatus Woesearchaeota archaeon]|nr:nucleotidyltransferase domain-containing protein [Candidatus Woesearchaeota archaeon]